MQHMVRYMVCLAAVAGLAFGAAAKEVTIDSYVQDGLIAQWDGIENVGKGEEHDPDATVWKDLVGNSDLPVVEGKGAFTENAFDCLAGKNGYAAGPIDNTIGTCQTLEIVLDRRGGSLPFSVGEGNKAVCFWQGKVQGTTGGFGGSWSGTNTATFTFVYENTTYYENGLRRGGGGTSGWGSANQLGIGAVSGYLSGYNYNGKIHSIRLYNRALTAGEIRKNALVDQMRFFGLADWPTAKISVSAQEGGLVSVNGGTWAQSVEQEIDLGDEAVVSFSSKTGASLKFWEVEGGPRHFVNDNAWSIVMSADVTAMARVRPAGEANRYADDYILDGLIAFWDGIENVGMGLPHDDATNVWKDLMGTRDLSLVSGNANFISNALVRTAGSTSGKMAQTSVTCTNYKTIEIVCDPPTGTSLLFCGGDDYHIIGSRANGVEGRSGGIYYTVSSPGTYAFVYDGNEPVAFYLDGVASDVKSGTDGWYTSAALWLGSYGNGQYAYLGNYYSLRLYDRALAPAELYANAQIDGARYFGRPIVERHSYVNVRGSGKVAVDGGAAEISHTLTPQMGDVVHLEAVAEEGWSFVSWETSDGLFYSTNALSPVIDYEMTSYCTLTAVFVETSKLSDKDVTNYVYDGLVGMWDGIVNAGHGKAHDSAATVWKDLVSSYDAVLVEGNAAFGENALQCLTHASGASAELPFPFNVVKTLEVVCEKSNAGYPFVSGIAPFVGFSSGKVFGRSGGDLWIATTNLATYTFVYGGAEPTFYENGLHRYVSDGFGGSLSGLDARIGLGSYAGKIHSIRIYDRVLSAEEIGHNADLDQARFFDAPPVCGTREFRVRVTSERGGRVVVTGGTKVGDGEYLVREGRSFALEAIPRAAHEFIGWRESLGAYVDAVNVLSNRIVLTAIADSEIVAGFDVRAPFMTAVAADYVQNGLIAQWDGIENVGQGLGHDSAATVWKDLVGTRDLPLVANRGSFTSNALYCAGGGYAAGPADLLTGVQTIEFVCNPMSSSLGYAVISGGAACLVVSSGGTFLQGSSRFYRFARTPTTLVWRSGAGYTADGVKARHTLQSDNWANADGQMFVGARMRGDYSWRGDAHAIRIYDRVLTDAELAHNFLLDSIRFFGRERPKKRTGSVLFVR